jgi:hypothetical protein
MQMVFANFSFCIKVGLFGTLDWPSLGEFSYPDPHGDTQPVGINPRYP